jgi:hypothetical protein
MSSRHLVIYRAVGLVVHVLLNAAGLGQLIFLSVGSSRAALMRDPVLAGRIARPLARASGGNVTSRSTFCSYGDVSSYRQTEIMRSFAGPAVAQGWHNREL